MKKKLLLLAVSAILATPTAFAATATDFQTITLTVPEVALLDITDATESLSLVAPTIAGTNFANVTAATNYAISANTKNDTSQKRKIDVAVTAGAIPTGGTLTVTPLTTGITGAGISAASLTKDITTGTALISGIGNIATTVTNGIGYSFGPTNPNEMVSYTSTSTDITLTYTLSADS